MKTLGIVRLLEIVALGAALALSSGCGGSGKGKTAGSSITVKGTLGSGITLASRDTGLRKVLGWFAPQRAYAAGASDVIDNVIAVDANGNYILATKSGNGFTLSLPQGRVYLVAFLSGMTTKAIYRADPNVGTTGWTALPVGSGSHDVDLGMIAFEPSALDTVATGSTDPDTLSTALGLAPGVRDAIGVWDAAMQRLANVDVDGDGVFDFQEGRRYDLTLHYEFNPNDTFAGIAGSFGDPSATTYAGYGYWLNVTAPGAHDWACATLTPPEGSSIGTGGFPQTSYNSTCGSVTNATECFYSSFGGGGMSVNFYCGSGSAPANLATSPYTPPAGTYVVTVDGATHYTFRGVTSQTIDANLNNLFIPTAKLTMSGAQVTRLDVVWWKHDPSSGSWVQVPAAELAAIVGSAGFEIADQYWDVNARVRGDLPLTPTASVNVPAQSGFTGQALRISYVDVFGYGYGVEWR